MLKDEEIKSKDSLELSDLIYDDEIPEYQKRLIAKELLSRAHGKVIGSETDVIYTAMEKLSMEELIELSKSSNSITASIAYTVLGGRMTDTKNGDYLWLTYKNLYLKKVHNV